jgi:thioesterase domain-containing protein
VPGLRYLFCGGGALTPALVEAAFRAQPGAGLINVYGPTEACVDAAFHLVDPAEAGGRALSVPIRRPIARTLLDLRDPEGRLVPLGAPGELWIGGAGLATGYLGAQTGGFVPTARGRRYRTGDRARFDARGRLVFLGRTDFQIKLDGHRIEPGEVEAALIASGAAAAVVQVRDGRLVAHVTGPVTPEALQDALRACLPRYMVPSAVVPVDRMPLTPAGKIDRAALPDPALPGGAGTQDNPRDQTELRLHSAWRRVLSARQIGLRDNFFDLGGTSIAAIKLVHEIAAEFDVRLPLRQVIANPTIEALGAALRPGGDGPQADDLLIPFREAEAGQPLLICVHPAGGTAFCYLSLAQGLPQDIGVIGVQSPGLNPGEALAESVEAMAGLYLDRLAGRIAAAGPVVLTGLSFGGLVAHEMGRRLAEAGRAFVTTLLLDTQGTEDEALRRAIDTVDMAEFRDKLVRFNGTYPGITDAQIERYFRVYNHNRLCVRDYAVPSTGAQTVFLQARSDLSRPVLHETRRFWRARAKGGLDVRLVRGDHWDMLETEELARVRAAVLRAATGDGP